MIKSSTMSSIISSVDIMDNTMNKIYAINERLNTIAEAGLDRISNHAKILLIEKSILIDKVLILRRRAIRLMFSDSGDYLMSEDKEEFMVNMTPFSRSLEEQYRNSEKIVPIIKAKCKKIEIGKQNFKI